MRILYLAQEPELREGDVVTGNAVRARQLAGAMRRAGHTVEHAWLTGPGEPADIRAGTFHHRDQLQALISQRRPEVILVGYWELLGLLPFGVVQPVVLDFVAPRPLEALYEDPGQAAGQIRRLRASLRRCDLVLVGNERQGRLLTLALIEAGFDLRGRLPLLTVALGATCVGPGRRERPGAEGWLLVTGGVRWPWRQQDDWLAALAHSTREAGLQARILCFEGAYRGHRPGPAAGSETPAAADTAIERRALMPYGEYSDFLTRQAHIGIELAERNIEREHSQSFRSLDFLRHGLPLLCNAYLPIARLVERHDAGWLIETPADLTAWAQSLQSQPEQWQDKSAAALRLVREALDPDRLAGPLLDWLESPQRPPRLPETSAATTAEPVLGVPPWSTRLQRQARLLRRAALLRITGLRKPGNGIVFVTRGDLFPPDHGAAVRTVETARALGSLGMDVAIVTDDHGGWYRYANGEFGRQRYPWWLRLLSLPAPLVKLLHYSKDLPSSNMFLYLPLTDRGFHWRVLFAAKTVRAGVLQAEFPAYVQPCLRVREAVNTPVVLVEHNVEYERLRSQVGALSSAQYQRLRAIEIDLCNRADAVVCVSDNDRQRLIEDGVEPAQLLTIPHGVHLDNYRAPPQDGLRERFSIGPDEPLLAFHGTFSYPPNRQAIAVLADTLLPALQRAGLNAHVLAIGRDPPPASPHPRIHFTGSVTDVAPWLKAADLAVIPLTDGGGTRMKIVDCFAAGLPVVTTGKGIEGIPVEPGRQALIIDDWDEMVAAISRLWRNPSERTALAEAGRVMAAALDWSEIARRYRSLYAGLT
jgi:glycosyltransferase involved in cell wall biosynthesis